MSYKLYDAEIEYLQANTIGPYIDTGIIGNSNLNYEIKFGYKKVSGYPYIFGAQQAEKQRRFSLMISSWANYTLIANDGTYECNITFSAAEATNPLVVKKVGHVVYINDIKKYTFLNTTYTTPLPITVFACNTPAGLHVNRLIGLPIYYFKIGNLDLIPVRKGDVGYFYDKNSHKLFGNAGTGKFILGPDVAPGRYANEVAFLESTGSQYIDTGILNNDNIVIETTMSAQGKNCLNGSESSSQYRFKWGTNGAGEGYYGYQKQGITFGNVLDLSKKYTFHLEKGNQYVVDCNDGTTVASSNAVITQYSTYPIYLFHLMSDGSFVTQDGIMRIFSCKIWQNDTLVRDFIPVEYNNIGYLYDKVSGEFFANQGTGKFVLGHRAPRFDGKACARSYTRRQLMAENYVGKAPNGYKWLEYIENTSSAYIDTGLKGKYNTKIDLTFLFKSVSGSDRPFVTGGNSTDWHYRNEAVCFVLYTIYDSLRVWYGIKGSGATGGSYSLGKYALNTVYNAQFSSEGFFINGRKSTDNFTEAWLDETKVTPSNIKIFNTAGAHKGNLYDAKIYEGETLVRDYKPIMRLSDGKVGLWDKVHQTFYTSPNGVNFVGG